MKGSMNSKERFRTYGKQQRVMRETAVQIGEFLEKYGFHSKDDIANEIDQLSDEAETAGTTN